MASYNEIIKMIKEVDDMDVEAVLPCKDYIYIYTKSYYNPEIHGDGGDFLDYDSEEAILIYFYKDQRWHGKTYSNLTKLSIESNKNKDISFVGALYSGNMIIQKGPVDNASNLTFIEEALPVGITSIANIDDEIFMVGAGAQVIQLKGESWIDCTDNAIKKYFSGNMSKKGFRHIDGFNQDEIYVSDKDGILWLRDKGDWRPIDLPVNQTIEQILCASDGNVYLNGGTYLLKGRKDQWTDIEINMLVTIDGLASINQLCWFQNELYILPETASFKGLFKLNADDEIISVSIEEVTDSKVFISGGKNSMSANDEFLLITGSDNIILFNGERWFNLFDKNRTEEELRATGTFYDPREL